MRALRSRVTRHRDALWLSFRENYFHSVLSPSERQGLDRAKLCREEFFKLRRAFRATFMRHVDLKLLEQVKARKNWLPL